MKVICYKNNENILKNIQEMFPKNKEINGLIEVYNSLNVLNKK